MSRYSHYTRLYALGVMVFSLMCQVAPSHTLAGVMEDASGVWAVDVPASLDLLDRRNLYSPNQIAEAAARARGIRIIFNPVARILAIRGNGGKHRALPLEGVTEKNGSLLLRLGGQEPDDILVTPLPNGRVRVGPPFNMILLKTAELPRAAAP